MYIAQHIELTVDEVMRLIIQNLVTTGRLPGTAAKYTMLYDRSSSHGNFKFNFKGNDNV